MDGLNWILGFLGAIISIGVLVGAALLGWRILRSTIDLLRTSQRPSVWSLLYYAGVLVLILVVVSVFIPLFFSSLATGIRDSRESAQDISIELNSWVIESIENARSGGYGQFPTRPPSTPWGAPPPATATPVPFIVPTDSALPATEVPTTALPAVVPPQPTIIIITPTAQPTMDLNTWNPATPPPTPVAGG